VRQLLEAASVQARIIGHVNPATSASAEESNDDSLGELRQLEEIIRIYEVDELIFCGKDLPASQFIALMVRLSQQTSIAYKILPADSEYIIGSSSKDAPGDYYALNIGLSLYQPQQMRNKRLLDILTSLGFLLGTPLFIWFEKRKAGFLRNCLRVLAGTRTWVGPHHSPGPRRTTRAILSPADVAEKGTPLTESTRRRLELLYARNYVPATDLNILYRRFRWLGQE
jgi:hypothetical protein